jgi:hypothetical protein
MFLCVDDTDKTRKAQRALTLWATGVITLQMVLESKNTRRTRHVGGGAAHNISLPKTFTYDNGTEESTAFNNVTWSTAMTKYMTFINTSLRSSSFDKIAVKAQEMVVSTG